ncbi:AraC-like DNA-binding protein [Gracilibacillus alcaliphilus]|nr:AraC-like DNA-binding protein [Gracilibacillus alcaliphilus]
MHTHSIRQTIDWIEQNLQTEIDIEDVRKISHFSKYHFHRLFQREVGMSVSQYIRMRRIVHAAIDLLNTSKRIIDIAFSYQFESQEVFTRAFKKIYHLPQDNIVH